MPREVPKYHAVVLQPRQYKYAVIVCALNEGERLIRQLTKMKANTAGLFDVIIADGPSTDGSTEPNRLKELGVHAVIVLEERGGLSSSLRASFAYVLEAGYSGAVIMDGHDKDDTEALHRFGKLLDDGLDFIQGSRFVPGGQAVNTPPRRTVLIRWIHAPYISVLCGKRFTDTTNGFRGFSRRFLEDEKVALFRKCFDQYELPYYLAWAACRYGFNVQEMPVTRAYPAAGPTPTKIIGFRGHWKMLKPLLMLLFRLY
ncbi:MAG TPA: glycosyltransferase family 2 protein [Planctomycetota bacterium]|nr:glycosyltransferase family 2 protein [Planctomycetota bacterium]